MKVLHLEARCDIKKIKFNVDDLPEKIGLTTTIQFIDGLELLKGYLESRGKIVMIAGQVLGCDQTAAMKIKDDVDCFIYFGSGKFHPIGVSKKTKKPVFTLHPATMELDQVDEELITQLDKRRQGQYAKFLEADNVGVMITKKSGQAQVQAMFNNILDLETKYKDKRFYFFIADTFDFNELDNFSYINSWINTMCPRIEEDITVLNLDDLKEFERS